MITVVLVSDFLNRMFVLSGVLLCECVKLARMSEALSGISGICNGKKQTHDPLSKYHLVYFHSSVSSFNTID